MSSSALWSCGCYPELGITPTMLSAGLCRVQVEMVCWVWDSCPDTRHNQSPIWRRDFSLVSTNWRGEDHERQGSAGAGGRAIGPARRRVRGGAGAAGIRAEFGGRPAAADGACAVSYTHLRAHETRHDLV